MTKRNPPSPHQITSAGTDEESADEGLSDLENAIQERRALKVMHERKLISDAEYKDRDLELQKIIDSAGA